MRRLQFSLLCVLTCWLATAAPTSISLAFDQIELDANRTLWDSHHLSDYDFVLGRSCFCDPVSVRPGLVSVRGGAIVSVLDVQTQEPRSPADFFTIDTLFDSMQLALDKSSPQVTAEFDNVLGYPRSVRFDDPELFDDDISYDISELRAVPEPGGLALGLIALATLRTMRRARRCRPRA